MKLFSSLYHLEPRMINSALSLIASFIFLQNDTMAFSSQTTSEKSSVLQKWVGAWPSPPCPGSLLIPDSMDTHFSAWYMHWNSLSLAAAPTWMSSLRSHSLSFLHPNITLTSSWSFPPPPPFFYPICHLRIPTWMLPIFQTQLYNQYIHLTHDHIC